ncbi:MAG TPA: universal stress protein [Chthoniobacterales bacterium]|jgi:nucleotide-binding universal stress UspA family protein
MKKILVPVDFSSATESVLAVAREVATAFDAELHLLHVREIATVPVFPAATAGYPGIGMPEMSVNAGSPAAAAEVAGIAVPNEREKTQLESLRRDLSERGLRVLAEEREGTVVAEILRAAAEIPADLIVMGSHGHGSVYNLLVGSVTEGVLKAGRYRTLLVPAPAAAK